MNLSQLIYEIGELGVQSPRLQSDYVRFINRAQRTICQRNSWSFMADRIEVTMPAGQTSVALPSNFKELQPEKSPVSYGDNLDGSGNAIPVQVSSRAVLQRTGWYVSFQPARLMRPIQFCFIEPSADGFTFNLPDSTVPSDDVVFKLSIFAFPDDLVLGSDHNALTDHGDLGDALLNKAKAIAYFAEDPTDKRGFACEELYQQHYKQALYADERAKLGGRAVHW